MVLPTALGPRNFGSVAELVAATDRFATQRRQRLPLDRPAVPRRAWDGRNAMFLGCYRWESPATGMSCSWSGPTPLQLVGLVDDPPPPASPASRSSTPVAPPSERAGDGNRTRVTSLEGWGSTVELHREGDQGSAVPNGAAALHRSVCWRPAPQETLGWTGTRPTTVTASRGGAPRRGRTPWRSRARRRWRAAATSNVSAEVGHVGAAHDGDEVVLAGAHHQRLHAGHLDDGVTHLPPTVLADLEEHERAHPVSDHRRVERRREPGDRPDTAQTLDPGMGRRARDVAIGGELGERQSAVGDQRAEDAPDRRRRCVDRGPGRCRCRDILSASRRHGDNRTELLPISCVNPSLPNRLWDMTTYDTGSPLVELADDHPGVSRSRSTSAAATRSPQAARRPAARRRRPRRSTTPQPRTPRGRPPSRRSANCTATRLRGIPRRRRAPRPADRSCAATRRRVAAACTTSPAGGSRPPPGWLRSASSTAPSATVASCRRSTSATLPSRCTRRSPT